MLLLPRWAATTLALATLTSAANVSSSTAAPPPGTGAGDRLVCFEFGRQAFVAATTLPECERQAARLQAVAAACTPAADDDEPVGQLAFGCHEVGVAAAFLVKPARCNADRQALRWVLVEAAWPGPVPDDDMGCSPGGFFDAAGSCERTVATLNSAIDMYADGTFTSCDRTTPTTTITTTATSTATTTATSTPVAGALSCIAHDNTYMLGAAATLGGGAGGCDQQARYLDTAVASCNGAAVQIRC